jgi:hypothetical protein
MMPGGARITEPDNQLQAGAVVLFWFGRVAEPGPFLPTPCTRYQLMKRRELTLFHGLRIFGAQHYAIVTVLPCNSRSKLLMLADFIPRGTSVHRNGAREAFKVFHGPLSTRKNRM